MNRRLLPFFVTFAVAFALPLAAQRPPKRDAQDIPAGYRPPPGMCRIWIDGVPPGHQPAPTDCATAIRRRPPSARVIFGDDVRQTPPRDHQGQPERPPVPTRTPGVQQSERKPEPKEPERKPEEPKPEPPKPEPPPPTPPPEPHPAPPTPEPPTS